MNRDEHGTTRDKAPRLDNRYLESSPWRRSPRSNGIVAIGIAVALAGLIGLAILEVAP